MATVHSLSVHSYMYLLPLLSGGGHSVDSEVNQLLFQVGCPSLLPVSWQPLGEGGREGGRRSEGGRGRGGGREGRREGGREEGGGRGGREGGRVLLIALT